MIERLADGVVVLDAERRIMSVNDAFAAMVGIDERTLTGQSIAAALAPRSSDGRAILVDGWDPAAESMRSVRGIAEQEVLLRRADKSDVTALVTGLYERDGDGRITSAVLSTRPPPGDATRRLRASRSYRPSATSCARRSHQ